MIRTIGLIILISLTTCLGCKDSKSTTSDAGVETVTGVSVSDKNARSCEVLLLENGAEITGVTQDDTVKAAYVRHTPKVAVTFTALTDTSIGRGAIGIVSAGSTSATIEVSKATCFDAEGKILDGATVSLQ